MFVWVVVLIAAVWGAYQAKRRGGNRKDMAQYAVGYGIAGFLVAFVLWIVLFRTLG